MIRLTILLSIFMLSSISCNRSSESKNIGLQLVSVRDAMEADPVGTIEKIGMMGYSFIETFVYNDGKFYGMEGQEFRDLVEKNGLKFKGSMTFQSLPDSVSWEATMDWWDKCISDHKSVGVEYITTTNLSGKSLTMDELKLYCRYFNVVGKKCKDAGIQFAYHNHTEEFLKVDGVVAYDYVIENTDPELVAFQADVYWMRIAGVEPTDYFNKYPGRYISWHVKDDTELGTSGKVDFAKYYELSEIAGLKYNVVEVEKYNFDTLVSVEMAIKYLNEAKYVTRYE